MEYISDGRKEKVVEVEDVADEIRRATNDPTIADVVVRRVAIAAADGMISRGELRRILDVIATKRRSGEIRKPGAYFITSAKDLFRRAGIPWST
jgi:hypothetical protein